MLRRKVVQSGFICMLFFSQLIQAQIISISGKLTDPTGKPVVSGSIRIMNTNRGASSDSVGSFNLRLKRSDSILISAIGYGDIVFVAGNRTNLVVVLRPAPKSLREVVVSGASQNTGIPSPEEVTREEIVQEYLQGVKIVDRQIDEGHKTCSATAVMLKNQILSTPAPDNLDPTPTVIR